LLTESASVLTTRGVNWNEFASLDKTVFWASGQALVPTNGVAWTQKAWTVMQSRGARQAPAAAVSHSVIAVVARTICFRFDVSRRTRAVR